MVQYELSLYEIGGNEPVDQIYPRLLTDADAILLVFSLGSNDAIQQLRFYQARLAQMAPEVPMFLVGMTADAGPQEGEQVRANEIEDMAHNWGTRGFWKTSLLAGLNAQSLLQDITAQPRSAGKTALKIIFAGPPRAGKTVLISRLANAPLSGTYTPTMGTEVSVVKVDIPATPPVGGEQTEMIPQSREESPDQSVLRGQVPAAHAAVPKGMAAPPQSKPPPPGAAAAPPAEVKFGFLNDEMLKELKRLKTPMKATANEIAAPSTPTTTSPPVQQDRARSDEGAPAPLTPPTPEIPEIVEQEQQRLRSVSSPELAGSVKPTAGPAGGEAFAMEKQEEVPATEAAPVLPTTTVSQPFPSPPVKPLTAPPSAEDDASVGKDGDKSDRKAKRKEAAKMEKKSREKSSPEEAEDMSRDMETGERALGKTALPVPAQTVTVERVLERKTTVFYRRQMNPLTRNKLSVVLSTLKIYEQLKLQTVVPAERVGGEKTLKIKELSPFVYAEPIFPGCICVPAQIPLDARKDSDTADFHITPLATGPIMDACVRLYYEGKLVDTIQTPTKVVNQTSAKISILAAVFFPIFGPLFDERIGPFLADVIPFWEQIGGIENFFLILAGALGFISTILYYIHRPKQAIPIEANFPELQKFLEEDVTRPDLAQVLKENMELEKGNNP